MSANTGLLVVCRSLADFILTGTSTAGLTLRTCVICEEPLGVSARGLEQANRGGFVLCNPCGVLMVERLKSAGRDVLVIQNEMAKAQLERLRAKEREK
jgi:hypothetical protein